MLAGISVMILAWIQIPGLQSDDLPFNAAHIATTVAFITVPLGVLLLLLARVFWHGRYLGIVAGYKDYGVADPKRMGRFVGILVGVLGVYQMIFPVTVRFWGQGAFIAYIFVIVGIGLALLIGGGYFERG
ncbi:MAG: hypothetical protein KAW67_07740 [Candidatus Eisenbacteria sp.]|nr:hypothetical protein [Candidatus Eisenbacteria bacterium]